MQKEGKIVYFLGANTPQGFYSLYDEWVDENRVAFYILKGGPGCGKSTLMRKIGEKLEADGQAVEYILCSGDPDSLDGIYVPGKNLAMMDGTSPHVMEPAYPGARGHYINLGDFYDRKALRGEGERLIELTARYKAHYAAAYRCLHTANEVLRHEENGLLTASAFSKVEKRVQGVLSREAKNRKGKTGKITHRFLSGLTCQGRLFLLETVQQKAKRIYELQESCGLAPVMLRLLEEGISRAGYDLISSPAPEDPTKLCHLLIPELSLAFVTTTPGNHLEKRPYRRIRMDSMADRELLQARRSKLRFAARISDGLTRDGIEKLRLAKETHDEMEALYHPHVDFRGVDKLTKALLAEIHTNLK